MGTRATATLLIQLHLQAKAVTAASPRLRWLVQQATEFVRIDETPRYAGTPRTASLCTHDLQQQRASRLLTGGLWL